MKEMEEKMKEMEEKMKEMEEKINLLEKKQEEDNIQVFEHLQFMNYSQKIKNTENEIYKIKSEINQQKREKYNSVSPLWR